MINTVYWDGLMTKHVELIFNLAVLVGTFFGQWIIGFFADRYGRKRLYGIELLVLTVATVFVAITSEGALRSTHKLAWFISWRFIMGIGIGGDYPLSAVITAEFAPRKHRGRMLATVFFMQPIGALLANLTAVIVVLSLRGRLPEGSMPRTCNQNRECVETIDLMWRWIVGVGAIPPAFAILLRWWIPESPRYTLEVEMNPDQAAKDVKEYFDNYDTSPRGSEGTIEPGILPHDFGKISAISPNTEATLTFGEPTVFKELQLSEPAIALSDGSSDHRVVRKETLSEWWAGFYRYLFEEGNWTDLAGTSVTWLILDFAFYFLGVNSPKILSKLWGSGSWLDYPLYNTLLENGYRALIAVSTGAVTGGALFIAMAEWRWHLQLYGFLVLAGLFVVVGICFVTLVGTRYSSAVIVLYSLCNLFFNFGELPLPSCSECSISRLTPSQAQTPPHSP
jgi:PHS family inorganic phosphate transporter-like MFS transporter